MRRWVKRLVGAVLVIGVALVATVFIGRSMYERRIDDDIDTLLDSANSAPDAPITEDDIAHLPDPVQRWLRESGVIGTTMPTTVRLRQEGELRVGDFGWLDYEAEEYFSTEPPAFLWAADVEMAPGVTVVGQDRYVDGEGLLEMRLLGLVPVASDEGPEMDEADLLRFLNETMWFPAAVLSPYITWEPIDAHSARATMTYEGASGSATFHIDDAGRLVNMTADRFDREYGAVVLWSTPITAWGTFDGIQVPTEGEAVYARPEGDHAYIRLNITDLQYDRPLRFGD